MIWWHQAQFALWNRPELLDRTLGWYEKAYPIAKEIAKRQGFDGIRWMKMTDPSGIEAPSKVGSFLIWQQPHLIYMAELLYRSNPNAEVLKKYNKLVQETAEFMYSFATYEKDKDRFVLKGAIPAQETLRAAETVNPPFELSYWHFAMSVAQKWRERIGEERNKKWDELIQKLSPLAAQDTLYLAAETALDTYKDIRFTSDHMQSHIVNGIVKVTYKDGSAEVLNLINPDNWCPIEQDYFVDGAAFKLQSPRPYRLHLLSGIVSDNLEKELHIEGVYGRSIKGGAGVLLDLPLNKNKELKSLELGTEANDVIIGLMAATLQR